MKDKSKNCNEFDDLIEGSKVGNVVPSKNKKVVSGKEKGLDSTEKEKYKRVLVSFSAPLLKRVDRHNGGNRSFFIMRALEKYLDDKNLE